MKQSKIIGNKENQFKLKRFLSMNNEDSLLQSEEHHSQKKIQPKFLSKIRDFLLKKQKSLENDPEFHEILKEIDEKIKERVKLPMKPLEEISENFQIKKKKTERESEFLKAIEKSDKNTNSFLTFLKSLKDNSTIVTS